MRWSVLESECDTSGWVEVYIDFFSAQWSFFRSTLTSVTLYFNVWQKLPSDIKQRAFEIQQFSSNTLRICSFDDLTLQKYSWYNTGSCQSAKYTAKWYVTTLAYRNNWYSFLLNTLDFLVLMVCVKSFYGNGEFKALRFFFPLKLTLMPHSHSQLFLQCQKLFFSSSFCLLTV